MSEAHGDVSKHVKAYIGVFLALAVGTIVTVLASFIHVSTPLHVFIALVIASVKASLVAWVFMHLKWERGFNVWFVIALCAFFFVLLILMPTLVVSDSPPGVLHQTWG